MKHEIHTTRSLAEAREALRIRDEADNRARAIEAEIEAARHNEALRAVRAKEREQIRAEDANDRLTLAADIEDDLDAPVPDIGDIIGDIGELIAFRVTLPPGVSLDKAMECMPDDWNIEDDAPEGEALDLWRAFLGAYVEGHTLVMIAAMRSAVELVKNAYKPEEIEAALAREGNVEAQIDAAIDGPGNAHPDDWIEATPEQAAILMAEAAKDEDDQGDAHPPVRIIDPPVRTVLCGCGWGAYLDAEALEVLAETGCPTCRNGFTVEEGWAEHG